MSALPDGFWGLPPAKPAKFHFFFEGDQRSLCGSVDADEITGDPERRRSGGMDCKTCADIYAELRAPVPAAEPEPDWTVKTNVLEKTHTLYYQGKPQSTVRGPGGLATQKELANIFNRNGTLPKKQKTRCAADAPNAAKFLQKKSRHSPELFVTASINSQPSTINLTPTMPAKAKALTPPPADIALPPAGEIPANQFRPAPANRTITPEQIAKMSDSIREVGLLQPITARLVEDPETGAGEYEIVLGECRWRGCLDIDENYPVPCFVRNLSDKDAAKLRAIENFQRKDLDPIEEARALQNLQDTGSSVDEITKFIGKKKDYIYQRLILLRLDDDAHTALRAGNISIKTAEKLAGLPEGQRADALQAVVSPVHSATKLPELQALKLIEEKFVEPLKRAEDWESRRQAILENHPGAKWLDYAAAKKIDGWNSGHVRTDQKPNYDLLSDAAVNEELVVPTWGELALKHGAEMVIGCNYQHQAYAYVQPQPIIDAEKAACSDNPGLCIFVHEAAVHQVREEAEKRKMEREAHAQAEKAETARILNLVLSPDGLSKTAVKKIVEMCCLDTLRGYAGRPDELAAIFEIDQGERPQEEWEALIDSAVTKFLRSKNYTPFEALGRLSIACHLHQNYAICEIVFDAGAVKKEDFPALHKNYLEVLADRKAEEDQAAAAAEPNDGKEESAA